MVQNQGINVYLAPLSDINNAFREYPVPATSPLSTANATEAYIEAEDGERFVVVVDLSEDFELKGSARLRIERFIDGEFLSHQVMPYVQLKEGEPPGSGLQGRYTNSRADLHLDGHLVKCGYAFAPLVMDENLVMHDNQVHRAVATYGSIVVKICRCVNVGTDRPRTTIINELPCDVFRASRVSAKAVIEDSHVSHAIQDLPMGLQFPLKPQFEIAHQREVVKMTGPEGDVMIFKIRGRSRTALQALEIITEDTTTTTPGTPVKQE